MTKVSLLIICFLICSCFGQFEFQFQQLNSHDVLLVSNSDLLQFTTNNTLKLISVSSNSSKAPQTPQFDHTLLRSEKIEAYIRRIFSLPIQTDYELCMSNQSKTFYQSLQGYSQCQYDLEVKKQDQLGNIKFNKNWRQQSQSLSQNIQIIVDYSEKAVRLPKLALSNLIEYLNKTGTNCSLQNQELVCSNFSSKNYHHDQLQIDIDNQPPIKLQLKDLVRQCPHLKLCSLWIKESQSAQLKLGSILLKRYSTKFQKDVVKFAPISFERPKIIKHVQKRKYEYMILIGGLLLGMLYFKKYRTSPYYSRLQIC